jgi:hypothetical protein
VRLRSGQGEGHASAAAFPVLGPDATAVRLHEPLRDREAEARAAAGAGAVGTPEALEDPAFRLQ